MRFPLLPFDLASLYTARAIFRQSGESAEKFRRRRRLVRRRGSEHEVVTAKPPAIHGQGQANQKSITVRLDFSAGADVEDVRRKALSGQC